MPICTRCRDEADELFPAKAGGRNSKVCAECIELLAEEAEITAEAESAMRDMMEYKG